MDVHITERAGVCRWCGCTEDDACPTGCSWANARGTLCSECHALDQAMKSRRGRRRIALTVQEAGALVDLVK